MKGPDARDFLHRLTTIDVKNMQPGEGKPGCLLTPQGKIRASFWLWNIEKDSFAFEFDAGVNDLWKTELLAAIEQFTFAENFALTDASTFECRWILQESGDDEKIASLGDDAYRCDHGKRDFGKNWISVWSPSASITSKMAANFGESTSPGLKELEHLRILSMSPRTDFEITRGSMPLEIGMSHWISGNKGCYPGQEIIEKVISIGSPSKRLVLIESLAGPLSLGAGIFDRSTSQEIGIITSVDPVHPTHCLGVVRKTHAKESTEVQIGTDREKAGKVIRVAPYA
jgi:folate-binding protein YgfZ